MNLRLDVVVLCGCLAGYPLEATVQHGLLCEDYSGSPGNGPSDGLIWVEGGTFIMGSADHYPEEGPQREIGVTGFWMDRHEVTNRQFAEFVQATGYVTVAERPLRAMDHPDIPATGLVAGSAVFTPPEQLARTSDMSRWWRYVPGADWRHPTGPESSIERRMNHPVVNVAWEDALAYARWRGRELPSEAQWEFAARSGNDGGQGAGHEPRGSRWLANTWQGEFPIRNSTADGYGGTAPVGCFPANDHALFDMIGNVWELTADFYTLAHNVDPSAPAALPARVIKGGSYLCAPNYCVRYRPTARQSQDADLGASHVGFRTVLNVEAVASEGR